MHECAGARFLMTRFILSKLTKSSVPTTLAAVLLAGWLTGPAMAEETDTLDTLGFPAKDFTYCARYAMESAMHVSYEIELVDRIIVEQCFDLGHVQGLDEPAMREIMAKQLSQFIRPPKYADYDPRAFSTAD